MNEGRVESKAAGGGLVRRRGAGLVEVGALIGLVSVVAISAVSVSGGKVREIFGGSANALALGMDGSLTGGVNLAGGVSGVNSPPVWTTASGQVGTVRPGASSGSAIATLSATDADGNVLSYAATGLPSWALLSSSGALTVASGQTPPSTASNQSFSFSATVSDGVGSPASSSFSIGLANTSPTISSSPTISLSPGSAPSALSALDAEGDGLTWSVVSGSLPSGLTLNSNGTWTGTASSSGSFSPTFRVSDGKGGTTDLAATLTVSDPCPGYKVAGQNKCVFTYLGSDQSFVVPAGISSLSVKLWGAGGAGTQTPSPYGYYGGGAGGYVAGTLAAASGNTLTIVVGGGGVGTTLFNPYGGGGAGGGIGGTGGGRSAIRLGSTELATAGAGGGGCSGNGGGGGGTVGGDGQQVFSPWSGWGGTQTAGGARGTDNLGYGWVGIAGSFLTGGDAQNRHNSGGGGGGYWGGGGASSSGHAGAGGGGSGYAGGLTGSTSLAGPNGNGTLSVNPPNAGDADRPSGVGIGGGTSILGGPGAVVISW